MPVMTKPGTVLLTCEPFVYVANLKLPTDICDTCLYRVRRLGGDGRTLRRCAGCRTVFYCSKACQRKGWKDGHKLECHGMKEMDREMTTEEDPRLVLRALLKLQDGKDHFDLVKTEKGEVKRRFNDLISHSEEIKKDELKMASVRATILIAQLYLELSPIKIGLPEEAELIEICGRLIINAFSISNDGKLGAGLYLAGSIFDHSCDEMASNVFEGTKMVVRSIKEIPKGLTIDKVTVSYIQTLMPSSERRNKLRETYYFHCECDKCTNGLFDKEMRSVICSKKGCKNEIDTEELRNPCGSCGNKMTDKEVENILNVEKEAIKGLAEEEGPNPMSTLSLLKQSNFSEGHWLVIKFNYNVYVKVTSEKDWAQAYYYGCKYLEGVRRYADHNNEEFGRTSARLSDLALFLDKMKESEEHLKAAKKALKISSGVNSECYQRLIPPLELKIEQAKFIKLHNLPFRLGAVD